jgi:hypothetical protein
MPENGSTKIRLLFYKFKAFLKKDAFFNENIKFIFKIYVITTFTLQFIYLSDIIIH